MTHIENELNLFNNTVEKFYIKAISCEMKGIVKEIRFLESLTDRLRSNLNFMSDKEKTNFINTNSKYISAEYIIDDCICKRNQF